MLDDDIEEKKSKTEEIRKARNEDKSSPKPDREKEVETCTVKAAMFVPFTVGGLLAKNLREVEYNMEKMCGHRLKIVEKCGTNLQDLLTTSNPWRGLLCTRKNCLLCDRKKPNAML